MDRLPGKLPYDLLGIVPVGPSTIACRPGQSVDLATSTQDVYGRKLTAREIVIGGRVGVLESGRYLVRALDKNSPRNESRKESAGK